MPVKPYELTESRWAHLRACAAQGLKIGAACKELGVVQTTVRKAANRQGRYEELMDLFPKHSECCLIRHLKPEDVAHLPLQVETEEQISQVKWLTKPWRNAA